MHLSALAAKLGLSVHDNRLRTVFCHISDDPLSRAFTAKRAVMPFRGRKRVETDKVSSRLQEMFANPVARQSRSGRLAYVHIPFCANRVCDMRSRLPNSAPSSTTGIRRSAARKMRYC